jgi:hypothetical protein
VVASAVASDPSADGVVVVAAADPSGCDAGVDAAAAVAVAVGQSGAAAQRSCEVGGNAVGDAVGDGGDCCGDEQVAGPQHPLV